jgi:hypothetical protein
MARRLLLVSFIALAFGATAVSAATFRWAGVKSPAKVGGTPGQQGAFLTLAAPEDWTNAVRSVHGRFPGARPWITWAVGPLREKVKDLTDEQRAHEKHLTAFDEAGLDVFLEIWPAKGEDVPAQIDAWLNALGGHRSIAGFSVDLEWYHGVDDTTAEAWNKALKAHDPDYRLMLKHWDLAAMPKAYAKTSDVICVNMSSEIDQAGMVKDFAEWAKALAPAAVAFQTGYPWDEGWWKDLKDPVKDLGASILDAVDSPSQELGLLWVTLKSPLTPGWDLTRSATPAPRPRSRPAR